ncbi:MAG: penicillin-binding protein 2 [Lachnospiraceae bacterium]|nr:penicillin-binding protein 2 [Lachnospiraceae bacterium]
MRRTNDSKRRNRNLRDVDDDLYLDLPEIDIHSADTRRTGRTSGRGSTYDRAGRRTSGQSRSTGQTGSRNSAMARHASESGYRNQNGRGIESINIRSGNRYDTNGRGSYAASGRAQNGRGGRSGRSGRSSTKEYTLITYLVLFLFLAMVAYFVYFMSFKSEDFIASSYNPRMNSLSAKVIRGDIETSDGKVIATTKVASDGTKTRSYPEGHTYAFVTGYSGKGMTGLEKTQNFKLLTSHTSVIEHIQNALKQQQNTGDTVISTVDSTVQEAAYKALGSAHGAVIAMDPETGRILAMVSKPDYDPNTIVSDWDSLNATSEESSPLLNRATQGLYAPGSTFKIVTALEYLREGNSVNDQFHCDGSYTHDGYTISCAAHEVHGDETTETAFVHSCNVAFAQMGLKLNVSDWKKTAEELLFNKKLPSSLGSSRKSTFALTTDSTDAEIMSTAFGQGRTTVTPAHMLMIVSAIANNGVLMKPTLVQAISSADKAVVQEEDPVSYKTLMSEDEAATLQTFMKEVAEHSTRGKLKSDSYTAYGKTGSAEYQTGVDNTHSWFVGFADNGQKKIAIAVIGEKKGYGVSFAVPAAKQVFDAYLK